MHGCRFILVLALWAVLSVSSASARLWESRAQIEQRYGPPFRTKGYPDRRSYFYAFENWEIRVKYFDGISEEESYRHRNRAARITDSEVRARITDSEVRTLLAANSAGKWSAEWHNEWMIDTPKGRARAMLHQRSVLDIYTQSSLDRRSSQPIERARTHEDEVFTGILLTLKQEGETTEPVFHARGLLIKMSWQYLANSRNPSLAPGKTYTLTLRDQDFFDEEDVVAFVTDRDHKSSSELTSSSEWTEDSKIYLLIRVQDGENVIFDRSVCEVHHIKMSEILAEYETSASTSADAQCAKDFPHYRNFLSGDCVIIPTKKASLYVCPKCVEACERSKH